LAVLFSYSSLGHEVLKISKRVSRVDEFPDKRQAIKGIPIGEQTIQRNRHIIGIFTILSESAAGGLGPPLMMGKKLIDPSPVIHERGTVAGEHKLHIHLSESGKAP
jgi:hypothetical protein